MSGPETISTRKSVSAFSHSSRLSISSAMCWSALYPVLRFSAVTFVVCVNSTILRWSLPPMPCSAPRQTRPPRAYPKELIGTAVDPQISGQHCCISEIVRVVAVCMVRPQGGRQYGEGIHDQPHRVCRYPCYGSRPLAGVVQGHPGPHANLALAVWGWGDGLHALSVKHNGRSGVYRVLFASRSAFDGCR